MTWGRAAVSRGRHHPPRRHLKRLFLALLGAATLVPAFAAAPACQMQQIADLPAHVAGEALMVTVMLNGAPATMTLQVETARNFVFKAAAQRLGLPLLRTRYDTGDAASIRTLQLGSLILNKLYFQALEDKPSDYWPQYRGRFAEPLVGGKAPHCCTNTT